MICARVIGPNGSCCPSTGGSPVAEPSVLVGVLVAPTERLGLGLPRGWRDEAVRVGVGVGEWVCGGAGELGSMVFTTAHGLDPSVPVVGCALAEAVPVGEVGAEVGVCESEAEDEADADALAESEGAADADAEPVAVGGAGLWQASIEGVPTGTCAADAASGTVATSVPASATRAGRPTTRAAARLVERRR